jgi:atypical dual specificity phosphatase
VDRINASPAARRLWLSAAFRPGCAIVVHLAMATETSSARAAARVDHPTVAPTMASSLVRSVARSFVAPGDADLAAGFAAVVVVDGDEAAGSAVTLLSSQRDGARRAVARAEGAPPTRLPGLVKYPRTRHLVDLGGSGVARDDLMVPARDAAALVGMAGTAAGGATLTVEEKVDGANVGFSVDAATGAILAQNRSHYVDAGSHAQFRPLAGYIAAHEDGLRRVLAGGARVLYGEWLHARHSVHYTRLTSLFVAFDVWDAGARRFLSRAAFRAALAGTGIAAVPEVAVARPVTLGRLRAAAVGTVSAFRDGGALAEGIVVRVDDGGWLVERVKLVRPDFIAGNAHWSRGPLERNLVVGDGALEAHGG